MMVEPPESRVLRFGDFELDAQTGELSQNGKRLLLPEQLFLVLAALTRRPGTLVTRDQMTREVWGDDVNVDFEHGLNAAIKRLREVLGDSAAEPRFIETLPRRGYRFIAPVESISPLRADGGEAVPVPPPVLRPRGRRAWPFALAVSLVLTFAALSAWRWTESPPSLQLTRLTSSSGLNTAPALSPDGALVAYASDRAGEGSLDIWVQALAGGEPIRITRGADDEDEPSFSPDGSQIVYTRRETGGIFVVGSLGGEPRLVVNVGRARTPRFSPDGQSIAYWVGQPTFARTNGGQIGITADIFVIPSSGGAPTRLPTGLSSARFPVWSPAGDRLLFLGGKRTGQSPIDWYVMPIAGSGEAVQTGAIDALTQAGVSGTAIPTVWTTVPTPGVLFSTEGQDPSNVWRLPVSPSGQITGNAERLTFGTALERSPTVARSGHLAFASMAENADIWRVALDPATGVATGALERVTDEVTTEALMNVSADGRLVAFISRRKQNEPWLKDMQTGRQWRFSAPGAVDGFQISPDGSRVAVHSTGSAASPIEIIPANGGPSSTFCLDCGNIEGWSGDGSRLLVSKGDPSALFIYGSPPTTGKALARHDTWNLLRPRFSPDGRWVAFHTTNSLTLRQIYVVPTTLDEPVPFNEWIPIATDFGMQPSWSPDGRGIYYFSDRDGTFCLYLQPLDPATKRPIGEPRVARHFHDPRLRPVVATMATNDAQAGYLYVNLTQTTGNIWLLKNR